ncbi:uncharacterized protein [Asterias amurensis]|uniref:uncharacterized protein n=1 Tax=Asterias amurensis TaxID=7602 RepID=UPI003AB47B82
MPNSSANYNLVAIGDDGVWMKLGREISKIDRCRLLRIPNSLNPYSICDKYQSRAIFLLPDAIKVYQGACSTWVQRLRFGPNVNTPIIAIVDDSTRNNEEEIKQLMQLNVINWIMTSQELQAVRIVRVLYRCETVIRRCLETSAGMIVRHGTRRIAYLRNAGRTSNTGTSYPMVEQSEAEQTGELFRGKRSHHVTDQTEHHPKRSKLEGETDEQHSSMAPSETSSLQSTLEPLSTLEPNSTLTPISTSEQEYTKSTSTLNSSKSTVGRSSTFSIPELVSSLSTSSNESRAQVTSFPTVGHTAHVQRGPSDKMLKNRQHNFINTVTEQAQSENAGTNLTNTPLSGRSKRASLQRRTDELNNKLDTAVMYLSRREREEKQQTFEDTMCLYSYRLELRNKLEAKEFEKPGNIEQFEFCGKIEITLEKAKLAVINKAEELEDKRFWMPRS